MLFSTLLSTALLVSSAVAAAAPSFSSSPNALALSASFDPIIAAYWTGLPHHRRTPFAVSATGKAAYLAFLSAPSYDAVVVQKVDPTTFAAVGDAVTISGAREAGGLVAHDDGFAVMVNVDATEGSIATLVRVGADGSETWRTALNGPTVDNSMGHTTSPDMNGDLAYSAAGDVYGAYFVVTAYDGSASGHYGDSIQYVDASSGQRQSLTGATSSGFGCSHNTGIALAPATAPPFASVCAEDHGGIWLNTATQYMAGVKIANENVTNGVSGEPMGGMGGSYSGLAQMQGGAYMFAWASRGSLDLVQDEWMGDGYVASSRPRWLNHNVAVAPLASKDSLAGDEAISTVGAAEGDAQVSWITESADTDHQNVHVAAFPGGEYALVTWEQLESPDCQPVPLSCTGTFAGTYMQLVDAAGAKVGEPLVEKAAYVAGDMRPVGEKLCWPYVQMDWDLSAPKANGTATEKISFACVSLDGAASSSSSSAVASGGKAASSTAAASSSTAATTSAAAAVPAEATSTKPATSTKAATTKAATASSTSTSKPVVAVSSATSKAVSSPAATSKAASATAAASSAPTVVVVTRTGVATTVTKTGSATTVTSTAGAAATSAAAAAGWTACTDSADCAADERCMGFRGGRKFCLRARGGARRSSA